MSDDKRKILFFYLNTGAGHISAAKVLQKYLQEESPNVEIKIINGFNRRNLLGKIVFEKFYNLSCNYLHGAFPLIYDIGEHRKFQKIVNLVMNFQRRKMEKILLKEQATDVISFHFALGPVLHNAVRKLNKTNTKKINITQIVTDPFTVPKAWFYEKDLNYFVYSQQAKEAGIECGINPSKITIIPFLMNTKYRTMYTTEQIIQKKKELGYDETKKLLLLVGGGEGLPGATDIINQCILHKSKFEIAIICGRDVAKKETLELLSKAYPRLGLHVYGFINYLDELIKICDCAVIKAGPATLFEILSCKKPVIICKYIHNQELGNMRYAIDKKVGYFIQKPNLIYKKVNQIMNQSDFDKKMKTNFDNLNIDTDCSKVAKILLNKSI